MSAEKIITENISLWTSAIKKRSATGRGSSKKIELYGIKKLRELILELAVRGKLVPQDESDEPASELLKRIQDEKSQLVKDKKIKKQKKQPKISEKEIPSDLPLGWKVLRLPEVAEYKPGKTPATKNNTYWTDSFNGVPWVSIADMDHYTSLQKTNKFVSQEAVKEVFKYEAIAAGTLIMSFKLTVGKISILDIDAYHNEAIISIVPFADFNKQFLFRVLPQIALGGNTKKAIKGNNLNSESLGLLVIPVPPLEEQHRIVAKIDELMKLCDQLELQTESSIEAHKRLVEFLLATLTDTNDADKLEQNWQRVSEHFDTLFTTEHSIDQLKQTILQLAVMGKLLPQDSSHQPASILLEKVTFDKKQLIKDKQVKKQKSLDSITDEEKITKLPKGWEWCRFADLSNEVATGPFGTMIHKRDYIEGGVPLINPSHMINSKIVEDMTITVSEKKAAELASYKLFENDIVMARRGEMGRCALVTKRETNWLCGTGSFVLRFNELVSRDYILLLFKTKWVRDYLGGNSIGITMTNLNHGILNKLPLLVPPNEEQHQIIFKVNE